MPSHSYCKEKPPHVDLRNHVWTPPTIPRAAKDVKNIPTALAFGSNKDPMDVFFLEVALMISTTMSLLVIETVAGCILFLANDDYKITIPCIGNGTLSMVLTFIGW